MRCQALAALCDVLAVFICVLKARLELEKGHTHLACSVEVQQRFVPVVSRPLPYLPHGSALLGTKVLQRNVRLLKEFLVQCLFCR